MTASKIVVEIEREREKERERGEREKETLNSPVSNPLYPVMHGSLHRLLEDPRDVSGVVAVICDFNKKE